MMAAMAGMPYKEASASSQLLFNNNYSNNRGYLDMQQKMPMPSYVRAHPRHHADHGGSNAGKRKSAVELLQESKAFYVKSETVLDRKQELKNSGHLQVSHLTAPGAPPRLLRKPTTTSCSIQPPLPQLPLSLTSPCCWTTCHPQDRDEIISPPRSLPPALPPKSPRLVPLPQRRTTTGPPNPTGSEQLQTKLRRLLNTDSKENICYPDPDYPIPSVRQSKDVGCEDTCRYSIENLSADCRDGERVYAAPDVVPFKFGRSNSHCHASGRKSSGEPGDCHKSLPDLHTSSRRRASLSPRTSTKSSSRQVVAPIRHQSGNCQDCETSSDYSDQSFKRDAVFYRGSRHIRRCQGSGGGDASSVLSSGGRTQKSSGSSKLSHGANARDSGGSSGHCTHRSEPSPRVQDRWSHVRRDSGASTQHSTERIASRKNSCNGGTPSPVARHYSPDSSSGNSQRDQSQGNPSKFSEVWKKGRGRMILRSKSDISDRYWRQDNGRNNPPVRSRSPRSTTQLESFFDHIGLDLENYQSITDMDSTSSSPVYFDSSVSSVDSALGVYSPSGNNQTNSSCQQWQNNNCSGGMSDAECNPRISDPPSIVERNARIIKWLCQCRKTQFGYS